MLVEQRGIISMAEPKLGSIYGSEEAEAVNRVLAESVDPTVGFRAEKEVLEFEAGFLRLCDCRNAIAFNGAGAALDLVVRSLNIQPDDEIISCAINFPGTHLAIIGNGAKLVFCEPDGRTINIDPENVRKRLSDRTRAIMVTHMNGLAADIHKLNEVLDQYGYPEGRKPKIICDAARSLGTTYRGRHVGKEAWVTIFSLQSKKIITTLGEGGMVVTDDDGLADVLRDYRSFGRGDNWGSNFKLTKVQAAVGVVQLGKLERLVGLRRNLAQERHQAFSVFPEISPVGDTDYSQNSYYLYTLILPENLGGVKRDRLIEVMRDEYGIGCVVGNPPTYKLNEYVRRQTAEKRLPLADNLGERIICISIHPSISAETNAYIIHSFIKAYSDIFVA